MKRLKQGYQFVIQRKKTFGVIFFILFLLFWFSIPRHLFNDPTCMVLEDRNGQLLGARISADGQWRFPFNSNVPKKFHDAIIAFEDKRFLSHHGVDFYGIGRAVVQNFKNNKVVSGASTISMQVIRMSRKRKKRTIIQKVIEMFAAWRMELTYSKDEILALYTSNAPFGGNVVGLDAAAWRYYGKKPKLLSWGEAATLAVLPNSPSLIRPGKNQHLLMAKRNRLLDKLVADGYMEQWKCDLAKEEPLPQKPHRLPRLSTHLLERAYKEKFRGKKHVITKLKTTVDKEIQKNILEIVKRNSRRVLGNGIHNMAVIVVDVPTGDILSYVGNVPNAGKKHQEDVDIIKAPRSTGSILKPILMAETLDDGIIFPETLIPDIPTHLMGYRPVNYYETYDGAVPLKKALSRSLNIPFIRLLGQYGLKKFHKDLQRLGFSTINKSADYYGLPLILGGAEANLWTITQTYSNMARTLSHFYPYNGKYDLKDFAGLNYDFNTPFVPSDASERVEQYPKLSAASIYQTFSAMQTLERPSSEGDWKSFGSSEKIAWKTGTSFGFRDAWAVGVNTQYAVGVWVGNADGEGRPGLVGVLAAAPVLFDVFDYLNPRGWFDAPYDEMKKMTICKESGFVASDLCPVDTVWVVDTKQKVKICPYHKMVHLDTTRQFQVSANCVTPDKMVHIPWFELPPLMEHYYKEKHPNYEVLPPFRADCQENGVEQPMQLIYPRQLTEIFVPVGLDGKIGRTVFKVAHRHPEQKIFWHIDNEYIGSTQSFHEMALNPTIGKHILTLVDEDGYRLVQRFVIRKRE